MGIDPSDKIQHASPTQKIKTPGSQPAKGSGVDFSTVFEKTVRTVQTQSTVHQQPVAPVIPGHPCCNSNKLGCEAHNGAMRTLDAIEHYQNLLADTRVTLRDVQPAVSKMKNEVESLEAALENMPQDDRIRKIISETLLIASKEIARFQMGYYND